MAKEPKNPGTGEKAEATLKPEKEEILKVPKSQLDDLIAKIDAQGEEITKLNAVADKSRLDWYRRNNPSEKEPTRFKLSTVNDKVIVA